MRPGQPGALAKGGDGFGTIRRQLVTRNSAIPIPKSYDIQFGDVTVKFPFEKPFPAQKVTMASTLSAIKGQQNALLESPTGTGKTLALLASCLAYMDSFSTVDRIYYTSRTHSQLKQVVNELKALSYFPKMAILASRRKLCIYPPVHSCKDVDTKCRELEVKHQGCPFDRVGAEVPYFGVDGQCPKFDLDDLIEYGQKNTLCPYYMAKRMAATAELVIAPYNYLVAPGRNLIVTGQCLVVFDEGHNMDSVCRGEASMEFTYTQLFNAGNDAAKAPPTSRYLHLFAFVRSLTMSWLRFIRDSRQVFNERKTEDMQYHTRESYSDLIARTEYNLEMCQRHGQQLMEWSSKIESDPAAYNDYVTAGLLAFAEEIGPKLVWITEETAADFRVAFIPGVSDWWDSIAIMCMRPGIIFQNVASKARSVIIASGTLSPFDALASELEAPFEVVKCAPHVVHDSQILTLSINRHLGVDITSTYSHMRERGQETYSAVSDVVEKLIATVPGSALLFLPSYRAKGELIAEMKESGALVRINRIKTVVEEESDKDAHHVLRLMEKANWNALMIGVHRGKVSEGIDFNDDKARMVILFGVPFSSFKSAEVELKMRYNDEMCGKRPGYLSGNKWYELQAYRALNQSIGRVIRHKNDYGVVVFLDRRISHQLDYLPNWVRKNMRENVTVNDAVRLLSSFYTEMHQRFPEYLPPPRPSTVPYDVPGPMPSSQPQDHNSQALVKDRKSQPVTERPASVSKEHKVREVNHNGTVIYCSQCNRPVMTLKTLDNTFFETVEMKGLLRATKNGALSSEMMMGVEDGDMNGLYCDVARPRWFEDDDCSYKIVTCDCGCVIGVQVSAVPSGSKYPSGLYIFVVRCLCLQLHGKFITFFDLASQLEKLG